MIRRDQSFSDLNLQPVGIFNIFSSVMFHLSVTCQRHQISQVFSNVQKVIIALVQKLKSCTLRPGAKYSGAELFFCLKKYFFISLLIFYLQDLPDFLNIII